MVEYVLSGPNLKYLPSFLEVLFDSVTYCSFISVSLFVDSCAVVSKLVAGLNRSFFFSNVSLPSLCLAKDVALNTLDPLPADEGIF